MRGEQATWAFAVRVQAIGESRWRYGTFNPVSRVIVLRDGTTLGRRQVRWINYYPDDDSTLGPLPYGDVGWMALFCAILDLPKDLWETELWGKRPSGGSVPAPELDSQDAVTHRIAPAPIPDEDDTEAFAPTRLLSLDALVEAEAVLEPDLVAVGD